MFARSGYRPVVAFVVAFALAFALAAATGARAYHTAFVRSTCNTNAPTAIPAISRAAGMSWALRARYEGYQWAGGCWNDSDADDAPGDPTQDPNTGGEGGDCSGFTYKAWFESPDQSDSSFWSWGMLRNVHGPYTSGAFQAGSGAANETAAKSLLVSMDALASSTHIGIVYARNPDGTDQILEAKGEAYGMGIWTRTYRGNPAYGGVRRSVWGN
jgi:hypothetical protein